MKVFLDMVGCRLNQSELEKYALQFRLAGHSLTSSAASADLVVINTCTVTAAAASDSRQKVRQAARAGAGQIVVTGCWATLNLQETLALPAVSQVISNQEKDDLVASVLNIPPGALAHKPIQRQPIPGSRLRTRAFIKVQDGCDNHCTYCVTRLARGQSRSRDLKFILEDIQSALLGGTQEIVLTGVHLGSWGYDFSQPAQLSKLVKAILDETSAPRIRLSSLEPWDISPEFFQLWQDPRLCRHLHLPLQSGSASVLQRMGRRITPRDYTHLICQARAAIPGVAITTDIITGFPGETEVEFSDSLAFVKAMKFAAGHVFTYSSRPNTAAALLPGQVPSSTSKQRSAQMRQVLEASSNAFKAQQVGKILPVLWEKAIQVNGQLCELSGLSDNDLRVSTSHPTPCYNQIMNVRIIGQNAGILVGEISTH